MHYIQATSQNFFLSGHVSQKNATAKFFLGLNRDHLGNVRLSYADTDNSGDITQNEIIEESHYMPFGLQHKGYNNIVSSNGNSTAQKFGYNGKEYQEDLGYNMHDFDMRHYDPAIARWIVVDPLAEEMRRHSPYNYAYDNPIYFIDPDGMKPFGGGGTDPKDAVKTASKVTKAVKRTLIKAELTVKSFIAEGLTNLKDGVVAVAKALEPKGGMSIWGNSSNGDEISGNGADTNTGSLDINDVPTPGGKTKGSGIVKKGHAVTKATASADKAIKQSGSIDTANTTDNATTGSSNSGSPVSSTDVKDTTTPALIEGFSGGEVAISNESNLAVGDAEIARDSTMFATQTYVKLDSVVVTRKDDKIKKP